MKTPDMNVITPTPDDLAHFAATRCPEEIRRRVLIERAIVRRAVTDLIAAGCALRLFDGENWAGGRTTDVGEIMAQLMATDEETLGVYGPEPTQRREVFLVYGNDGWDVIADNSASLEDLLAGATKLAEELSELI